MTLKEDVLDLTAGEFGQACRYTSIRNPDDYTDRSVNVIFGDVELLNLGEDQRGDRRVEATIGHVADNFSPDVGDLIRDASGHTYAVESVASTSFGSDKMVHILGMVSA